MEYVNLGRSGLKVSRICLGMLSFGSSQSRPWILDEADSRPIVQRAVELGITFFDTADMYSEGASEEVTGRMLRDFFPRRDEYVLATKVFYPMGDKPNQRGLSRKHVMSAVEESLRRLGTDYIDLYQIHRWDYETPIEEVLAALHDLVTSGKVRYIGASSMWAWQFIKAQYTADLHGWTRFVSMQNHYNLLVREEEREMIPCCIDQGVGVIPWSPLARGLLAGKRSRHAAGESKRAQSDDLAAYYYHRDQDWDIVERVVEVAGRLGVVPAQVAIAWLLHKPGITSPIVGATKIEHLEDAVKALGVSLSPQDIAYLEELYEPKPVLEYS